MTLRLFVCLLACFFAASATAQPPVIFLVRHAERAAISGHVPSDTGLSAAGRKRAEALARELKDAQITAIYTTEYKRTRETAAPLAQSLGIRPEVIPGDDLRALIAKLKASSGKCARGWAFQHAAANHQRARSLLSGHGGRIRLRQSFSRRP